jgi:hypothetical protein
MYELVSVFISKYIKYIVSTKPIKIINEAFVNEKSKEPKRIENTGSI